MVGGSPLVMVILVVLVNGAIALGNFYLAWRLWRSRHALRCLTQTLRLQEQRWRQSPPTLADYGRLLRAIRRDYAQWRGLWQQGRSLWRGYQSFRQWRQGKGYDRPKLPPVDSP